METEKKRRGRPPLSEEEKAARKAGEVAKSPYNRVQPYKFGQEYVEEGDNSKYLRHAMEIMKQPRIDISDPRQVEDRLDWYFEHCAINDMKPTVKGFCNALGVSRQTLWNWRNGVHRGAEHELIIINAYNMLEELWEDYMQNGKINPMSGVFLGVNNFGYRDVKQVSIEPVVNNAPAEPDVATIEAKYAELPED